MSIGSTLQQARVSAGLSLAHVSERTRMRQTLIVGIERDDFAPCGGEVYARGHIRSIARVVGIDPEPLIKEFDALYGNPSESVIDLIDSSPVLAKPARNPWRPALAVAGLALFVIAGVAIAQGDSDSPSPLAQPSTSTSPTTPSTPDPSTTEPDAIADAGEGVTFTVTASFGNSWVSVRDADGLQIGRAEILRKGESRTFTDDTNLKVTIGNAGGVEVIINGQPLGVAGAPGAVVRFDIKPGDPGLG